MKKLSLLVFALLTLASLGCRQRQDTSVTLGAGDQAAAKDGLIPKSGRYVSTAFKSCAFSLSDIKSERNRLTGFLVTYANEKGSADCLSADGLQVRYVNCKAGRCDRSVDKSGVESAARPFLVWSETSVLTETEVQFNAGNVYAYETHIIEQGSPQMTNNQVVLKIDETAVPQKGKFSGVGDPVCSITLCEIVTMNGKLSSVLVSASQKHSSDICLLREGAKLRYSQCEKGICKTARDEVYGKTMNDMPLKIYSRDYVGIRTEFNTSPAGDPAGIVSVDNVFKIDAN